MSENHTLPAASIAGPSPNASPSATRTGSAPSTARPASPARADPAAIPASNPTVHSKLIRYDSGDASMLGFLAGSHPDHNVEIRLDKKYRVHDVLADRDLGLTDTIRATLKGEQDLPGSIYFVTHVRLYSLMPVKIEDLVIEAPPAARAGDEVRFSLKIPGDLTGATTVYLTVHGPDGRHLRHYDRSMLVGYGGEGLAGSLKLALNDEPGEWKITARDMLSGARAEHVLTVKP